MIETGRSRTSASSTGKKSVADDGLLENPEWKKLVRQMIIHADVDLNRLTDAILRGLRQRDLNDDPAVKSELFDRMVIRVAILDAAVTEPRKRRDLPAVAAQTSLYFPNRWQDLVDGLDKKRREKLVKMTQELSHPREFGRKPDQVIGAFEPRLIGAESYEKDLAGSPESNSAMLVTGPDLYKTTLRNSYKALMGAVGLRKALNAVKPMLAAMMTATVPTPDVQAMDNPQKDKRVEAAETEQERKGAESSGLLSAQGGAAEQRAAKTA